MSPTDITPISIAGPGQALCTSRGPATSADPMSCTREHGHDLPHEAVGAGGTVYARWVDWGQDAFDDGQRPAPSSPVTVPTPSRPARIAALHAAGLFLAENTDLPMPEDVVMEVHGLTPQQLRAIAQLHGSEVRFTANFAYVDVIVGLETLHGIAITYRAYGSKA